MSPKKLNGSPFDFNSRALNGDVSTYDLYYEIEVLQDLDFTAQTADVIPWFGRSGKGKQSMWNIGINPETTYPFTLSELAELGKIKITIKSSPSGNFSTLVNTVIQQ